MFRAIFVILALIHSPVGHSATEFMYMHGIHKVISKDGDKCLVRDKVYLACTYNGSKRLSLNHSQVLSAGSLILAPLPKRVLIVGWTEAATALRLMIRLMDPESIIDLVEPNSHTLSLAQKYFEWPHEDQLTNNFSFPFADYLQAANEQEIKYDLIVLSGSEEIITTDHLETARQIINTGGVISLLSRDKDPRTVATFATVFGSVFYHAKFEDADVLQAGFPLPDETIINEYAAARAKQFWQGFRINIADLMLTMESVGDDWKSHDPYSSGASETKYDIYLFIILLLSFGFFLLNVYDFIRGFFVKGENHGK